MSAWAEIERLEAELAEARAGNERLRETYARVSATHAARADRVDEAREEIEQLQKQLADCRTDILKLQAVVKAERLDHISTIGEVQKANEQFADCRAALHQMSILVHIVGSNGGMTDEHHRQEDALRKAGGL